MKRWLPLLIVAALLPGCASWTKKAERRREMAYTHRQLAQVKFSQRELAVAIREYRRSIELNDRDPEAHFGLAEAYRHKGRLEQAEEHLDRAIHLRPDHMEARLQRGVVYMQQERWEDAIAAFRELADDPTFIRPARALVNLGWAQYKSGDLETARQTLELAVSTEHSNYTAHLDLGIVLYDMGQLVPAIQRFADVLRIIEGRPAAVFGLTEAEARFRVAQAYVQLGKHREAVQQLEVAAKRGGKTEWGRKSREYLEILR